MNLMAEYKEAKKRAKAAIESANAIVKDAFLEAANVIFDKYPNLESFSWYQYTPYFNDGDECVFRANTEYPEVTFTDGTSLDTNDGDDENPADEAKVAKEIKAVEDFLAQFEEEDYRQMFDDHSRITVTRKGIDQEEYSHD
jgi:hypothetical protein